jgi:hypothetical protein
MENTKNQITLTVVVQDDKSQPTQGAKVSIKPSDSTSVTDSAGEVQFKLGNDTRYEVTATYGSKTVTVPYYVTKNGATRLVVNPTYVRTIEKQLHPYSFLGSNIFIYVGIGLGIIILFFVTRKLLIRIKRKRRIKNKNSEANKN